MKSGFILGHCVRVETVELPLEGFDATTFTILGADVDKDKRIKTMLQCAHAFIENNPELKRE